MPMTDMCEVDILLNVVKLPTPGWHQTRGASQDRGGSQPSGCECSCHHRGSSSDTGCETICTNSSEAKSARELSQRAKTKFAELESNMKDAGAIVSAPDGTRVNLPRVTMKLSFIDPISLFKNLAASDIISKAFSGLGLIVDEPAEL